MMDEARIHFSGPRRLSWVVNLNDPAGMNANPAGELKSIRRPQRWTNEPDTNPKPKKDRRLILLCQVAAAVLESV
jgi:hypothetical protein